ncbi:MAG: hemolysin family protein [Muribaculaceae bacterium]|nr:hemolysin family protein [Muribaculaceae bacterium]
MTDLIIIICLIMLNGVFSMSEVALISARKSKLSADAKAGSSKAKAALELAGEPDRFLSTVQIGITLIGILTGLFSGATIAADVADWLIARGVKAAYATTVSKTIIVAAVTYLSIVVGELVPKRIGLGSADSIAKAVAPLMKLLSKIAYPAVWLLSVSTKGITRLLRLDRNASAVTEEEIKSLIREGTEAGEVREVEQDIMERALVLGDLRVSSIMTVRKDVVCLSVDMDCDTVRGIVSGELHSAYPVYDRDRKTVKGIISLKQLILKVFDCSLRIADLLSPAFFIPNSMSVYDALDTFRRERVYSALVCDEYGDFCGVVTLRDILDGLVGDCPGSPDDEQMLMKRPDSDEWLVSGQMPVYDFLAAFDREDLYTPEPYTTMGGLMMNFLQRVPAVGDVAEWHGFRLEVVDMDGARVDKIAALTPR